MYQLLVEAAERTPVLGNAEGSYLTMKSNSGMLFAASTIATGFSVSSFCSFPPILFRLLYHSILVGCLPRSR